MSEAENLEIIEAIWDARRGTGSIQDATVAAVSDDVEWWEAGPPEAHPWAGTRCGRDGVAGWVDVLNSVMEYDRAHPYERHAAGDTVVEPFHGEGHAKTTGRSFRSDTVRIYTMHRGRIVRVRNFCDTAAYLAALRGDV